MGNLFLPNHLLDETRGCHSIDRKRIEIDPSSGLISLDNELACDMDQSAGDCSGPNFAQGDVGINEVAAPVLSNLYVLADREGSWTEATELPS